MDLVQPLKRAWLTSADFSRYLSESDPIFQAALDAASGFGEAMRQLGDTLDALPRRRSRGLRRHIRNVKATRG